jgi:hypothetical protein
MARPFNERKRMRRTITTAVVVLVASLATAGTATAEPNPSHASCIGLGSAFYAHGAGTEGVTGVRADVAHLVQDFAPVPGVYLSTFAQEKEGGAIPAPCGARIE